MTPAGPFRKSTRTEMLRSYITIQTANMITGSAPPAISFQPGPRIQTRPVHWNTRCRPALEWDFGRRISISNIAAPNAHDPLLARVPAPVVDTVLGRTGTFDSPTLSLELTHDRESVATNDFDMPLERTSPQFTQYWKYDANGNEVEHRDRDGRVYRSVYNSWNSLWQSIDPLGNVCIFDITVQGLVARFTDPGGAVTEYEWDLREKLVAVREVGGFTERYLRDPAGNVIEKFDSSGQTQARWESVLATSSKLLFWPQEKSTCLNSTLKAAWSRPRHLPVA